MTEMIDMARFVEAKSDQLNADDLIGISKTITVTKVTGADGDQPVSIYYKGDNGKPFKPCKTIRRVLMAVWGRNAAEYVGKSMTLYRDDKVTFGGLETGGIRISHMSDIDREMMVVIMKTKGKKAPYKVLPLVNGAPTQDGIDRATAEQDIRDADTLEALKNVWLRKVMAPHREALADMLEQRKAELSFAEGPADSDRGETNTATADEDAEADKLIGFMATKVTMIDLNSLMSDWKDKIVTWSDENRDRVAIEQQKRVDEIKAGQ